MKKQACRVARAVLMIAGLALWLGGSRIEAADAWAGQWIGLQNASQPNTWLCFRKQVTMAAHPRSVIARIACDSKYWLWINGRLVVFEGELKRGPTPSGTYFDEVDIAPYLKKGDNTIAVLLWYWGKNGFSHNSSGRAGLLFETHGLGKEITSDANWKVIVHPAYRQTESRHPNYRLSESNVSFDARKDLAGWREGAFDDSSWASASAYGTPPAGPWGALEKRPILQWKNSGLRYYSGFPRWIVVHGL